MRPRISSLFLITLVLLAFVVVTPEPTPAFSFMYVEKNDPLPSLTFSEFKTGKAITFEKTGDRPILFVFWGADIQEKKERSVEVLKNIENIHSFFFERNFDVAAVNVQLDDPEVIQEVVEQSGTGFPVYTDPNHHAFERLGVFVMPSVLIVNSDGLIAEGIGYSRNLTEVIPGEIQVMLHEKTREQLEAELHPEVVEKSAAQRHATIEYNYALNLVQRKNIAAAIDKLHKAMENDPEFAPAVIELGCLYIEQKEFEKAETYLEKGLALITDSGRGLACREKLITERAAVPQEEAAEEIVPDPSSWGFFDAGDDDEEDESAAGEESQK